jgi:hypothetical protein
MVCLSMVLRLRDAMVQTIVLFQVRKVVVCIKLKNMFVKCIFYLNHD